MLEGLELLRMKMSPIDSQGGGALGFLGAAIGLVGYWPTVAMRGGQAVAERGEQAGP